MSRFGFMETASDVSNIIAGSWDWMKYASTIGQVPEYHKYLLGSIRLSSWLDKMSGANPIPIVVNLIQSCVAKYDAEIQAHGKTQRGDLLEYLREKTDAQGEKLPDTEVVHHLLANLLAGADTTATGLRAVFYFLVKHPDVLAKLQGELDAARAAGRISETITYAQGTNLPYLMAVIKEALRLHPVIGFPLERIVPAGGAVVAGRFLPAGTIVGVNTWVLHRHSVFGAQPDVFLPERWLSASPAQLRAMEANWLVFGKGSRECVGKYIALMDLVKCVGQVCRGWELEWVGAEVRDKEGKVVGRREEWSVGCHQFARQDGVVLKVTRREGKA
jgi:cytochrome P450